LWGGGGADCTGGETRFFEKKAERKRNRNGVVDKERIRVGGGTRGGESPSRQIAPRSGLPKRHRR